MPQFPLPAPVLTAAPPHPTPPPRRLVLPYVRHLKGEDDKPLPPSKPRKQYKVSKGAETGEKSKRAKKEKGREQVRGPPPPPRPQLMWLRCRSSPRTPHRPPGLSVAGGNPLGWPGKSQEGCSWLGKEESGGLKGSQRWGGGWGAAGTPARGRGRARHPHPKSPLLADASG